MNKKKKKSTDLLQWSYYQGYWYKPLFLINVNYTFPCVLWQTSSLSHFFETTANKRLSTAVWTSLWPGILSCWSAERSLLERLWFCFSSSRTFSCQCSILSSSSRPDPATWGRHQPVQTFFLSLTSCINLVVILGKIIKKMKKNVKSQHKKHSVERNIITVKTSA